MAPSKDHAAGEQRIVVIGSSAGGIDALRRAVAGLPTDFGAPIVIAQHLDPRRLSHLGAILSRATSLRVRIVDDQAPLEDGVVFVVPSNQHVEIADHHLRLRPRVDGEPTPSVDRLLSTAADAFGAGVIAIVLTGSGSDGAVGAQAVKAAGGTVIIEDPASAQFPSMPLALPRSIVDAVVEPETLGPLLVDLTAPGVGAADDAEIEAFLVRLRERSGVDFSAYKPATIGRRIVSRMHATGRTTLAEYASLVGANQQEYDRLLSSLLIKVTQFFRDEAVWQPLRERILPDLVRACRESQRELRIWSAGCSTGEEAYSLALLATEAMGTDRERLGLRVFATDLDADAVAFARRGTYPVAALDAVPADLRDRFVVRHDGTFQIVPGIRDAIVFGEHDLSTGAPFPRTDLVMCRNVLIYFTHALQRLALEAFAYSLQPDGVLVLGLSETTTALPDAFRLVPGAPGVYRRSAVAAAPPARARVRAARIGRTAEGSDQARAIRSTRQEGGRDAAGEAGNRLLSEGTAGVVVVDQHYDVRRINAAARRLLGIHGGAFEQDLVHLARSLPPDELRAAIDSAVEGQATDRIVALNDDDGPGTGPTHLRIVARADVSTPATGSGAVIELFDVSELVEARARLAEQARVTGRLKAAHARVSRANEELAGTVADLRASNQAMLAGAEEAQATREEMETLNEEFQATNEELETLNEELSAGVDELTQSNLELRARTEELRLEREELAAARVHTEEERLRLESILRSLGDPMVVVDPAGRVQLTSVAYDRAFGTALSPFESMARTAAFVGTGRDPLEALAAGERFESAFSDEAPDGSTRWYEAVAEPVVTPSGPLGGVLAIRDVTERTARGILEQLLAAAAHELRTPLAALRGMVELTARQIERGDPQAHRTALRADHQVQRVASALDRLFDATQARTGRLRLRPTKSDIVGVVRDAVEQAEALPGDPSIALHLGSSRVTGWVDPERLGQAVLALLTNAARHAPGARVEVSVVKDSQEALITVTDTGPGFTPEQLGTLFRPFAGWTEPGGTRHPSLGLGLYLANEIVSAHGGTIDASSGPTGGARVSIRVPLARQADAA